MPKALFSNKVSLDYLNPTFLERLLNLLAEARMLGYEYKVYSGYRSIDEQRVLYKLYLGGGSKAAPPGLSAHNYGLAIDCGRWLGGKVSWLDDDLKLLGQLAPKHKLVWGGTFADQPHIQMPLYVTGPQLLPLKTIWSQTQGDELTKLKAVWATIRSDQ